VKTENEKVKQNTKIFMQQNFYSGIGSIRIHKMFSAGVCSSIGSILRIRMFSKINSGRPNIDPMFFPVGDIDH